MTPLYMQYLLSAPKLPALVPQKLMALPFLFQEKAGNSSQRKQYRRNRRFLELVDGEVLEEENEEMRIFLYTQ